MAYKKGSGAKAVAGYGSATRDVAATKKMWEGIESLWSSAQDVGSAVSLATGEADTAWEEYEAGYKELGGKDFKRPEWGDKGYFKSRFKGPEGEVQIGDMMYDREKIQDVGSFLSTDTATALFSREGGDAARERYLKRAVPGRDLRQEQLNLMKKGKAPSVFRQTREGGAPIIQDNSLDAILQRQSASATSADKGTSIVSYGGGGRRIDPDIKSTSNEFIDKKFDGGGDVVTTKSGIPSLAEQSASATATDKRTAIIGRGGGGRNIDTSIKYTGNEFIDKKLSGYRTSSTVKGTGQTLDQILEEQSISATSADKGTSIVSYGGGGRRIDPSIKYTGNEFIDRQLDGTSSAIKGTSQSLDQTLQEQSISATAADRGTSVIGYGGGGIGIDPNIQSTGNEFIDRQLGGYTEPPPASIYPESRYGEWLRRQREGQQRFKQTGSYNLLEAKDGNNRRLNKGPYEGSIY